MTITPPPLVTCKIYGQIGNQLFQIAATLAYAWDYNAVPIFPGLHNPNWNIAHNKDRLFFRINASQPSRPFLHLFNESSWYSPARIPFRPDQILDGYFQSYKHFHHHKEKILKIFAPSDLTLNYLQSKYADLLSLPNTVGIHVRTQSKRTHDLGIHPFWGMAYYQQAIDLFPANSTFVVFSDRINWCKKHFINRNFIYIEGNYGIEDFFLLAKCKHNILCNSSFSWWAGYFNQNPHAKIVLPHDWKEAPLHPNPNPEEFFLPEWTLLDCPPKEIYPTDMFFYDQTSQSVDNHNN